MTITMALKYIKPKKLKVDAIRLELLNELRKEGKDQKKELEKTIKTWKDEKPNFKSLISLTSNYAAVATGPSGNTKGAQKWQWINDGTKIRWALMSSDWQSKTKKGTFKSTRGRGKVVIAGKRAMMQRGIAPRKGIEARDWSGKLTKQRKVPFQRRLIKAMQRAGKNAF